MNDIIDRKQRCWNERLKKCILEGGYTQESFAHALNKSTVQNSPKKPLVDG